MIMLCIALTKDAMFEIVQILDVQEVLGNFLFSLSSYVIYDAKRKGGSIYLRLVYLRTRE